MPDPLIHIIGGGLAGSEAAWQAASFGIKVVIHEMRDGTRKTPAHTTANLAELVCSNSFRSDDKMGNAVGLLHEELRHCNSLIMKMADKHQVPAGGALAVDRHAFSLAVEEAIATHPLITISREEVTSLPPASFGSTIIATGPLTSDALSQSILTITGTEYLAFFDAIAPIVYRDSINFDIAWYQSRYDKTGPGGSGKDYINCPLTEKQYKDFIEALLQAEKTDFKEWEKNTPYFEGCLPIEVMAERGWKTLAFGPMKPVGLQNPHTNEAAYAVVQLRQDNKQGSLYNMVGFQTKLKYGEQSRIFRMIPGLESAEFARLGGIHRNTFLHSPSLLDSSLRLKKAPHIRFAGQITGVEGYVESTAIGLLAGVFAAMECTGQSIPSPSAACALGALLNHITIGHISHEGEDRDQKNTSFQPMNINYGLFPPLPYRIDKNKKKQAIAERALTEISRWTGLLPYQSSQPDQRIA